MIPEASPDEVRRLIELEPEVAKELCSLINTLMFPLSVGARMNLLSSMIFSYLLNMDEPTALAYCDYMKNINDLLNAK